MNEPKRPPIVSELPRTLYLETTNRCNSKCQTCVRTFLTREPPKDLTLAELQRIVDQFPVLERVVLHGVGEPLLNRELFAIGAMVYTDCYIISESFGKPTFANPITANRMNAYKAEVFKTIFIGP